MRIFFCQIDVEISKATLISCTKQCVLCVKELLFHLTASAAAANTNGDPSANAGDNDTCLQLALEGEKLCKGGNCRDGVAFFEAALQAGTDDFRTLSAIYR